MVKLYYLRIDTGVVIYGHQGSYTFLSPKANANYLKVSHFLIAPYLLLRNTDEIKHYGLPLSPKAFLEDFDAFIVNKAEETNIHGMENLFGEAFGKLLKEV